MPSNGYSNLESRKLSYEAVSPDTMNTLKMMHSSSSDVPFVDNANGQLRIDTEMEGMGQLHQDKEATGCDWDSLISDASELLNFDSPRDTVPYKGPGQNTLDLKTFEAGDNPSEKHEGLNEHHQTVATSLNNFETGEPVEDTDNEVRIQNKAKISSCDHI